MVNHLTNDQISRWISGQAAEAETLHLQSCGACAAEIDQFLGVLGAFKSTLTVRADRLAGGRRSRSPQALQSLQEAVGGEWRTFGSLLEFPSLWTSLKSVVVDTLYPHRTETTATRLEVPEIWSPHRFGFSRWVSVGLHILAFGVLALSAMLPPSYLSTKTDVTLLETRTPLVLNLPPGDRSGGGGGGGMRTPEPPSRGVLPRGAEEQLVPPAVEARNLLPDVIVESTIVVPQLSVLQALDVPIGDPNGAIGRPSAGPGTGGGIGTGGGTGVGDGRGPGFGPGTGGGFGGGIFSVGGGVSEPTLISQQQPEYSDDARKARIQGTVELLIVVEPDGKVRFDSVQKSLGYGLDQKAMEAVSKWVFLPAKKDGMAVPVYVSVVVNFTLR